MDTILVTGAFGNVGMSTLDALLEQGRRVRAFDLDTPANRRAARLYAGKLDVTWGDLRNSADVTAAVADCNAVIHLAAIIPPLSEKNPQLAEAVNVGGTRNLVAAMEAAPHKPRLVFTSSISVHGKRTDTLRADMPLTASDHYSGHKVACEGLIRESRVPWTILRLAAVMPLKLGQMDPIMFEIGLDNPVEYAHTRDVGLALANAVASEQVWGRAFLIGGGPRCQMTYREFFQRFLDTLGVGALPEHAYANKTYYTPWLDTADGEALLRYQRHTYDDYLAEIRAITGWKRPFIVALRPFIRYWMIAQSPYAKQGKNALERSPA